jgi:hypothetical protein
MHGMLTEITMAMKIVHPMSVVRGPKRFRRCAKMGDKAAEAIFAEPKLYESDRVRSEFYATQSVEVGANSQDAVCETTAGEEPFIDKADARCEQKTA